MANTLQKFEFRLEERLNREKPEIREMVKTLRRIVMSVASFREDGFDNPVLRYRDPTWKRNDEIWVFIGNSHDYVALHFTDKELPSKIFRSPTEIDHDYIVNTLQLYLKGKDFRDNPSDLNETDLGLWRFANTDRHPPIQNPVVEDSEDAVDVVVNYTYGPGATRTKRAKKIVEALQELGGGWFTETAFLEKLKRPALLYYDWGGLEELIADRKIEVSKPIDSEHRWDFPIRLRTKGK